MKISTTAQRLREELTRNKMRPIDLVNLCQPICEKENVKIAKNHISQYLSGKVQPSQKKISIIARVLNVDEAYLMGYDVPRDIGQRVFLSKEMKETLVNFFSEDILNLVLKEYPILIQNFIESNKAKINEYINKKE